MLIRAGSISKVLRGIVLLLGLIELVWIAGYLLTDLGGIIGVVVALVLFPITISVAPVYGVLVYGDWTGVIVFALGAVSMVGAAMLDPDFERVKAPAFIKGTATTVAAQRCLERPGNGLGKRLGSNET